MDVFENFVVDWDDAIGKSPSWETVLPKAKRLGGPTEYGNSKWADFNRCPYRYHLKHNKRLDSTDLSDALEIGGAFHEAIAVYYEKDTTSAFELIRRIKEVTPVVGLEVDRLFKGWLKFYGPGQPRDLRHFNVAVELAVQQARPFPYSARIDQIICKKDGIWIVEHKTSGARYMDLVKSYQMDSQLIGQVYLWNKTSYAKEYGKCVGVAVDLVTKTKEIGCYWEEVAIGSKLVRAWEKDMIAIAREKQACELNNAWPRKRHNCSKYNHLCIYFDYCLSNGKDRNRLAIKRKAK